MGEDYLSNIKMGNVFSSPIMKQLFSFSASGKPKSLNTTVSIRSGVSELLVYSGNTDIILIIISYTSSCQFDCSLIKNIKNRATRRISSISKIFFTSHKLREGRVKKGEGIRVREEMFGVSVAESSFLEVPNRTIGQPSMSNFFPQRHTQKHT